MMQWLSKGHFSIQILKRNLQKTGRFQHPKTGKQPTPLKSHLTENELKKKKETGERKTAKS